MCLEASFERANRRVTPDRPANNRCELESCSLVVGITILAHESRRMIESKYYTCGITLEMIGFIVYGKIGLIRSRKLPVSYR